MSQVKSIDTKLIRIFFFKNRCLLIDSARKIELYRITEDFALFIPVITKLILFLFVDELIYVKHLIEFILKHDNIIIVKIKYCSVRN